MSWKDFIYYNREQQIAIISLLVLIFIALVTNLLFATKKNTQVVINQNDSLIAAFEAFYNSIEVDNKNINNYTSSIVAKNVNNQTEINSASGDNINNKIEIAKTEYQSSNKLKRGETIKLNSVDTTDWKKVPGIGSAFANRIVKYRNLLGGYVDVEQLREVYGMDYERYQNILPYIELDLAITKININKLEFKELLKHPYLNFKQVQAITNLRRKKGDVKSLNEISVLIEFTEEDIYRLEPYIEF